MKETYATGTGLHEWIERAGTTRLPTSGETCVDGLGREQVLVFGLSWASPSLFQPPSLQQTFRATSLSPRCRRVFPSAARPGTIIQAEVRGNLIKGAYAVWFDDEGLRGQVLRTKSGWKTTQPGNSDKDPLGNPSKQPPGKDRVWVEVQIGRRARPGCHPLRLVAPRGLLWTSLW